MSDLTKAIISLHPEAKWSLDGNDYAGLQWLSEDITKPTEEELTNEQARLEAEATANAYKEKRVAEYPSIGDQLDALFHAGVFPEDMTTQIQTVKNKYPKEAD
tara:strand:+ start:153 stop:461 length:309 start_codon:yes stop_codon:yes gene_type:complete